MTAGMLDGKTAIVTGGGRGIGEAIAVELARLGASVVLAARTQADLARVAARIMDDGGAALPMPTDVTDERSVAELVTAAVGRFGRLDVLVNNAGQGVFEPVAESDAESWWRTVEVNLKGTYLCTRAALPRMTSQGSGHVVNILSIASKTPFPASSAYCAGKAGALMFTRVLAAEVREQGIRVTALMPGATHTPFWENSSADLDLSKMMPPERVAEAVAFVVTQKAGAVTDELLVMPPGGIL